MVSVGPEPEAKPKNLGGRPRKETSADNFGRLIAGALKVVASVRGDFWAVPANKITEEIGEPLDRMLSRNTGLGKAVAAATDPILLVMGCMAIFGPPAMIELARIQAAKGNHASQGHAQARPSAGPTGEETIEASPLSVESVEAMRIESGDNNPVDEQLRQLLIESAYEQA